MTRKLKPTHFWRTHGWLFVAVAIALVAVWLVSGCTAWRLPAKTVEVSTPVFVTPPAPEIVIRRYQPAVIPEWVAPTDPAASSCLKAGGEDEIRRNSIEEQKIRKAARMWAGEGEL